MFFYWKKKPQTKGIFHKFIYYITTLQVQVYKKNDRRTYFCTLKEETGSMAVEMVTAFPFFLFAMLTILMFGQIFMADQEIHRSMVECARELAISPKPEETAITAKIHWLQNVDQKYIDHSCIKGGTNGVHFFGSRYEEEAGEIVLQTRYEATIPLPVFHKLRWKLGYEIHQKAFRGYDPALEGEESTWVYVTEHQSVYHTSRGCSHLQLKIQQAWNTKEYLAGTSGYQPCEICMKKCKQIKQLYITEQGRKYHSTLACSGLKRTIRRVKKEEVGNLAPCSRCG